MWWIIYFLILTTFNVIGLFSMLSNMMSIKPSFADLITIASSILMTVGLLSYIKRKKVFSGRIWKYYYWFLIFDIGFHIIYTYTPLNTVFDIPQFLRLSMEDDISSLASVITYILVIPSVYAIYQLTNDVFLEEKGKKVEKK